MIKISHEIPKQLFTAHNWINDYPYVLGHLLMEDTVHYDKEYADFYQAEIEKSEFSILDNAGFELGESIDSETLYQLGEKYKPSHIVLPDVAFDRDKTLERTFDYIRKYGDKSTPKFIACVQGQGFQDLLEVFGTYEMIEEIDIIAISCCIVDRSIKNKLARAYYMRDLFEQRDHGIGKKIHLLGCKHPNEFLCYSEQDKQYIHSIDTSAPVIYGWNGVRFDSTGIDINIKKPEEKLADNLNKHLWQDQIDNIAHNVRTMRSYIN